MAKPFLKWVGGKRQLLPKINENLPPLEDVDVYIEPFLGGGAVFFDIIKTKKFEKIVVSDVNPELTLCYEILRDENNTLRTEFRTLVNGWPSDDESRKEVYYSLRNGWNQGLSIVDEDAQNESYWDEANIKAPDWCNIE